MNKEEKIDVMKGKVEEIVKQKLCNLWCFQGRKMQRIAKEKHCFVSSSYKER